jgi:hypothetical protein
MGGLEGIGMFSGFSTTGCPIIQSTHPTRFMAMIIQSAIWILAAYAVEIKNGGFFQIPIKRKSVLILRKHWKKLMALPFIGPTGRIGQTRAKNQQFRVFANVMIAKNRG